MQTNSSQRTHWTACVCAEDAARFFGWPTYFMSFLARAGHLKPLAKPAQNSRKWYAMVELEQLARDRDWLDKALRIVEKQIRAHNSKKKGKVAMGVLETAGSKCQ